MLTLSGEATKAEYQEVLRSVHFASESEDPSPANRNLTITVNDGQADSAPVTSVIYVVPVNDAPVISFDSTKFVEQKGAVALVENLSITDVDNQTFSKVVVTVDHLVSGDLLTNADVLKAHIEGCVASAIESGDEELKAAKLAEIERVVDKLAK